MTYLLMMLLSMLARPQLQGDLSNTVTAHQEKTKYMIIGTRQKLFRRLECWSKLKRNVSWDKNFRNVYENPAHSNIINHSIIKLKRVQFFTKRRCDDFTVATKLLFRKLIQKFSQCSLGSRLGSRRQKG